MYGIFFLSLKKSQIVQNKIRVLRDTLAFVNANQLIIYTVSIKFKFASR